MFPPSYFPTSYFASSYWADFGFTIIVIHQFFALKEMSRTTEVSFGLMAPESITVGEIEGLTRHALEDISLTPTVVFAKVVSEFVLQVELSPQSNS